MAQHAPQFLKIVNDAKSRIREVTVNDVKSKFKRGEQFTLDWAVTRVWFIPLTREEIEAYVATGEPVDKAGAYAIQGLASKFIQRIDGSYTNVVGLPIETVYKHLRKWGG